MARRIPAHPAHPERICWGCEKYCAANDLRCGNGKERTQHPIETFGPDWTAFVLSAEDDPAGQTNARRIPGRQAVPRT